MCYGPKNASGSPLGVAAPVSVFTVQVQMLVPCTFRVLYIAYLCLRLIPTFLPKDLAANEAVVVVSEKGELLVVGTRRDVTTHSVTRS